MSDLANFVRKLGGLERLLHFYAAEHPRHFCVIAELTGAIDPQAFRPALDQVQARHQMLSVFVADVPGRGPCFFRSDRPIDLKFVPFAEESDWRSVVERELAAPFSDGEAPLMRMTVLHGADRATLVLTFHHAASDGLSGMHVVQDLMEALSGRSLQKLPNLMPLEALAAKALLPPGASIAPRPLPGIDADALRAIAARPLWRPFEGDRPRVSTVEFDQVFSTLLHRRSKAKGTTVHGALCAALVRSVSLSEGKEAYTITSPVSLRAMLGIEERCCGLLLGAGTGRFPLGDAEDFWGLARRVTYELAPARTADGVLDFLGAIKAALPAEGDSALASGIFGAMQYDAIVSNLGVLSLPTEVGSLRLTAFWGTAVQGRFANEVVIGAASLGGRLRVMQTAPAHIPSVLGRLRETLAEICAGG